MTDNSLPKERWVPCPAPAVADTIRWREPLWAEPNKPRGKPDKIGEQAITAKILAMGDPVELKVISVKRLSVMEGVADAPSKIQEGNIIRRKLSSVQSGECQKLSEEI